MINLIKNELIKVFHKKAIYILGIVTILFAVLNFVIVKSLDNNTLMVESEKALYKLTETELSNYDLSNPEEAKWYVEELTDLELFKAASEFEYDSWQFYMARNEGYESVYCRNEAKYILKDDAKYEECNNSYNKFLDEIKNNDWKFFINRQIEEKNNEISTLKLALNEITSDADKNADEKSIQKLEYELEGLNYRLEKNIPFKNDNKSLLIDQYVSSAIEYLDIVKDEELYTNKDDLINKRNIEQNYFISKYKLEHDIIPDSILPANEAIVSEFSIPISFVFVAVILIAGTIVAEEYNKGTIKQLLLKPYSRTKILLSKYITSLIVFVLFLIFFCIVDCIAYGLASGFNTLVQPYIVYSFISKSVLEMNIFAAVGMQTLAVLPVYLTLLTLAFFMSTATGNSGLSITVPLLVYFFSSLINMMIINYKVKILSIFPTMCWDFSEYLYGGIPQFKYANFGVSICVCVITFLILFIGSIIIFKKKNIKNQ